MDISAGGRSAGSRDDADGVHGAYKGVALTGSRHRSL